jgi:hypothetical protein
MRFHLKLTSALLALALASAPASAQQQRRWSVTGTASIVSSGMDDPYALLGLPQVQRLAERALSGPLSEADIQGALSGTSATIEQILNADILRRRGDRYVLGFNVVTADDKRLIRTVANPAGRRLADMILAERPRFERIMARYDLPGVDRDLLAMALIGCVMLDWDGLGVTAEGHYRTRPVRKANGDTYIMTMLEVAPGVSVRGLYYGSHNNVVAGDRVTLTTFGDHERPRRAGFPDLGGLVTAERMPAFLAPHVAAALATVLQDSLGDHQEVAGPLMVALRDGPRTAAELAAAAGREPAQVGRTLQLLEALLYVERQDDRYRTRIPVFTARDAPMLAEFRELGKDVMRRWLEREYGPIRAQLAGLASVRAGVPYEIVFTGLWHDLFGWANYHLAASGFLYDPYGPDAEFVSFAPFVWESSLNLQQGTAIR